MKGFKMTKKILSTCLFFVFVLCSSTVLAKAALDGFDPVSYFEKGKTRPDKGQSEFQASFAEKTYYFKSKENLERFKKSPQNFLPQYAGNCAACTA